MDGIILIDKPKGWTSFDAVAKIRGVVRRETGLKKPKVGHTGTLDPLATGLLVLVIGSYTKQVSELSRADKIYSVKMRLGENSSTGDAEGERTYISDKVPDKISLERVISSFVGEIDQVPPVYSAIKINGQRAYKLAREGKPVKMEPRKVIIYEIDEVIYNYPELSFITKVSSGTYIRSLVEDIGKALETGAYMTDLCRTKVGSFDLNEAVEPGGVTDENIQSLLRSV